MTRLVTTTAICLTFCLPLAVQQAAAQQTLAGPDPGTTTLGGAATLSRVRASDVLDQPVFASPQGNGTPMPAVDEPPADWQRVGPIVDVILSTEGQVAELVVDVGGMSGSGSRLVGLDFTAIDFVPDSDDPGMFHVLFRGNVTSLASGPEWDWEMARSGESPRDVQNGFVSGEETGLVAEQQTLDDNATDVLPDSAQAPGMDATPQGGPDGVPQGGMNLSAASPEVEYSDDAARGTGTPLGADRVAALTTDDLIGSDVLGRGGEDIGEISDVVIDSDAHFTAIVVDIGGFLGLGERQVALPMEDVSFYEWDAPRQIVAEVDYTREQLETMEEFEG